MGESRKNDATSLRVLILAAGRASRFNGEVKSFLHINGEPIIERMINQLRGYGIGPIYIAVGHGAEQFVDLKNVALIPNPDYEKGDNALGLKVALDVIGFADTLILDGDLVLSPGALKPLLAMYEEFGESVSLIDPDFNDAEAMKTVIKGGRIIEYSKEYGTGAEVCTLVTKVTLEAIYPDLEGIRWWGVGVGEGKLSPRAASISKDATWIEIDTLEDYFLAQKLFEDLGAP